jgi:hypothetical protein
MLSAVPVVSWFSVPTAIVVADILNPVPTVNHCEAPAESSQKTILSALGSDKLSIPK